MIAVDHVTKTYGGSFTAVDDVNFAARPGRVTGFLGPNGAGKSTTLRVVVGLTPPDHGTAHVLGRRFQDLPNPGMEVGVLLDASAQHAGRTGREVLGISQATMGLPRRRVEEVLDVVGLSEDEAARRLRDYSLGMRQRLGLAHALLGDPEVLILDEPANGLDPAGIRWMRDLLRGYADRGATVLLSSHLLHEIEVVADDLVVIGHGRVVAAGTKTDLLAGGGTHVATRHPEALVSALRQAGLTHHLLNSGSLPGTDGGVGASEFRVEEDAEAVGRVAWSAGVALSELRAADGAGLEEMFLELTADTQRDRPALAHRSSTRSSRMTSHTIPGTLLDTASGTAPSGPTAPASARPTNRRIPTRVPLSRMVVVEVRKNFDTRSGRWLLGSLGLAALLTTGAIIAWAPVNQLAYSEFTLAIGVPMTIILPIIAALSVTSEWTQRSGLATFTLVPHRGRVVLAKAIAAVLVTIPATGAAFGVGAVGNIAGAAMADVPAVWNQSFVDVGYFALGQTLLLLVGFVLGALVRNSSGAIVAYMLYGFVVPGLSAFLAFNQSWFADARPWVDAKYSQDALLRGELTGDEWSQLVITSLVWLVLPMVVAVAYVVRSEVK